MTPSEPLAVKQKAQSPFFIPSLDGIRALAFLLVFLGHVGMPGIPGGFGVTVFFFLSGYLITTLLRLEVARTGRVNFKLFYLRRVLRILPPFYLVLLSALALVRFGALSGRLLLPSVLSQLFHYFNYWVAFHGFDGVPDGTGVYWSLAIEEHFYFLFPALYMLLTHAKLSGERQRLVFWLICAGVLVWRCLLVFHFNAPVARTYLSTDTRCDSLLLGCSLAVAGNPVLDHPRSDDPPSRTLSASLILSTTMLLVSFLVRGEQFRETLRYTLQIVALLPFFYAAIRHPTWGAFRLFNVPVMRFLGKLSYSLYLVHQVVIALSWKWLAFGGLARVLVAFAASLAISWSIWVCVEQPCARLRKRIEVYQPRES